MEIILYTLGGILTGTCLGILATVKGININITITHKQEQPSKETPKYNESLVDLLPPNVKQYYHENNGQNRF